MPMSTDLKKLRVLVTPTSFAKNDPGLRASLEEQVGEVVYNTTGKPLSAADLRRLVPGIDGFIAGLDAITAEVFEAADRLKVIARYGVGVDAVDLEAARRKGVVVTNTPGANSVSVAELTLGLMLSLARDIPAAVNATRRGEWPRWQGLSLEGKTIGLLGFGAIGRHVARLLGNFDCTLLAYDPIADAAQASALGVRLVSQAEVVSQADFLSLHCPVTDETRGLVDAAFLASMKPGAFLINTARGELVDENALLEALDSGRLKGAALDAFVTEPPAKDSPLLSHPRLIATPHSGAHTDGATNAMGWMALRDCLAVLRGAEPLYRVI
jgi:D-3-phosphoglycerate dehydrogenase